ncbi:MAG: ferredoxin [Gordonia sp. (in: high G+C Gram-positive bacteria)]|uniref:ferredoxin n=1 Tax=Gordonia TaxID=2053 RepID=UPI003266E209
MADEETDPAGPELTVVADMDLCEGYGECVKAAPEFYAFDDDGFVSIADPHVPPEAEGRVIAGVRRCPKSALTLLADGKPVELP